MKKKINRNILIMIIIAIAIIIVGIILISIIPKNKGEEKPKYTNSYKFIKDKNPDIKEYTNDKLNSKHCLNDICIENAKFYYKENEGKVVYTITNNSKKEKEVFLYMIFNEKKLLIHYKKLKPNEKVTSYSEYIGVDIENKDDYTLQALTEEQKNSIIGLK